jgi:hypothetical protein
MKKYLIDSNRYINHELKDNFFHKFIKYKLLTPNEIKYYILDNVQYLHLNPSVVNKYIKNFELEYIDALKDNITTSEKCIFILLSNYKFVSHDTIDSTFKLLIKKNDYSYIYYNIIKESIQKYPIKQIQNIFITNLTNYSVQRTNWILNDLFKLCFIENTYHEPNQILYNYLISNKSNFTKNIFIKYTNLYKVD